MELIFADDGSFYIDFAGQAEGTAYHVIYRDANDINLQPEIEALLQRFEHSLSVYDPDSLISRLNRNEDVPLDDFFVQVFEKAKEINCLTEGAFDPSAEPLFRLRGFSSENRKQTTDEDIALALQSSGMGKVHIENNRLIKDNSSITLNFNAIAKGYSADVVARLLEAEGIANYLIEIGGEIRVRGENPSGGAWKIGIDQPSEEKLRVGEKLQTVIELTDCAVATSGNYRQFYIDNGQKMVHTIDPRTGCPATHNLLSATVIANDAMTADAFATAMMVTGVDKAKEWIGKYPFIEGLLIYDEEGIFKIWKSFGH